MPVECQEILDLEFSADGKQLAVGGRGGPVIVWNTAAALLAEAEEKEETVATASKEGAD